MGWPETIIGLATVIAAIFTVLQFFKKDLSVSVEKNKIDKSVFVSVKHNFPTFSENRLSDHKLEVALINTDSNQAFSVREFDWGLNKSSQKSPVKASFEMPFLIPPEGIIFENTLDDILIPIPNYEYLGNWDKAEVLGSLQVEVELMTGQVLVFPLPISLKIALFRKYASSRWFYWWYQYLLKKFDRFYTKDLPR